MLFRLGERIYPVERGKVHACLKQGDVVETPIGELRVVHTPGHTGGHVSYFHERHGWLFSGDAILNIIPLIRKTGLSLPMAVFSIDMREAARSVKTLATLRPTALLAGHGPPHLEDTADALCRFAARLPE
jgi:glyoxylase-like metal-dependent hydrolase (beta-lactamase superfamily II)